MTGGQRPSQASKCKRADPQSVAIVYVSTDTSLQLYSHATANQPWLKLIYRDGSDFAAVGEEMDEKTSRGEDFVQAAVSAFRSVGVAFAP